MIRPQTQHLADRNCGYDTTNTTHRLTVTHAQRMQQAGRSAYTVHLVYSRLGSVVGSRNSKLQPLTAVHPESGLLATGAEEAQDGRGIVSCSATTGHAGCAPSSARAARGPCPTVQEDAAGQPAHLRRKTRPLEIPIFFSSLLARDSLRRTVTKQGIQCTGTLPTFFLLPHVRLRISRLDASAVIKLSMTLGPQMVGGPLLGCGAPEWALSKLSFDLSSHDFSI